VPLELICIEVTESALMEDPVHAEETLRQLHKLGVKLFIDDYGTGYSSLSYIKKFSVDELKIDRTFDSGMNNDLRSSAIVRSTIELGHNLGMSVVAEGVEIDHELTELTRFGCDHVQGFKLCKPMAMTQLMDWMNTSIWSSGATKRMLAVTKSIPI
jgi:diguanylate cyclase